MMRVGMFSKELIYVVRFIVKERVSGSESLQCGVTKKE
jgi:hypothetical protein